MEGSASHDDQISHGRFTGYDLGQKIKKVAEKTKKLGKDDPRRIVHAFKVGLALTLVSLFYYFKPLYDGFGVNAMWAVLTVVVVFEFSVGATLAKGFNRMVATLLAGGLGVGAHRLATLSGRSGEPVLIAVFVFIIAAVVTYARFYPAMKARYDYGMLIFILTFSLVSVSGYRDAQVLKMAKERLMTIMVGSCTTILVCVCICPVWVGQDLHNLVVDNLEKLGNFLEGFGGEYFQESDQNGESSTKHDKSFIQGYKSVLTCKNSEETMANLAKWEPCHGRFRFRHPWKQYLKIGTLTRECAYKIEALNCYLNTNTTVQKSNLEIKRKIQESCTKISQGTGKALKELASTTRKMRRSRSADLHIISSKAAAEELKALLKTINLENIDILEIVSVAAVASLLLDIIECSQKVAETIYDLGDLARFKNMDAIVTPESSLVHTQEKTVGQVRPVLNGSQHVITIIE